MWIAASNDACPVELENVIKRYGSRTALDDVSLRVEPGITGLVGPNGAGKSTLVRTVLGLVNLASGSVRVFGLNPQKSPRQVRQLVGVVPEDESAVPGLTGVGMVRYAARLCGIPSSEALRRAHEVLDWCGAGQERYRPLETFSVGTRQKVAFAAAIVHDPPLIILDEPTNGLDPIERKAMLGRLVTLARDHGKTIFLCTHVLPDVQAICERAIVLAAGRVRLAGSIDELTRPALPMHRVEGTGPLERLADILSATGIAASFLQTSRGPAVEVATPADGDTPAVLRVVCQRAREVGVGVRSFEPAQRPLEEVFIASLKEAEAANSTEVLHATA